ncbi:MAG: sulfotransferase domain-containing protein [Planctomycetales bacterium]|nr:sulfotransferase domain-containing protein [Planctomycetales bacterium]
MLGRLREGLHSRSGLVRKGSAFALQIPKLLLSRGANHAQYCQTPPVLANSFPKSGTHLLDQIAEGLPGRCNYGEFISSMTSSFQMRERTVPNTCRVVGRSLPGELVRAHIFYHPDVEAVLEKLNFLSLFIYRDPRDVAISAAHYLRSMNPWHRLHKYFKRCRDMEEAILLSIRGLRREDASIPLDDIAASWQRYAGWTKSGSTLAFRFEDLVGERRDEELRRIAQKYADLSTESIDVDAVSLALRNSIAPEKSHTFRQGSTGKWREQFTPACRDAFKEVGGDMLIELGYESDLNW